MYKTPCVDTYGHKPVMSRLLWHFIDCWSHLWSTNLCLPSPGGQAQGAVHTIQVPCHEAIALAQVPLILHFLLVCIWGRAMRTHTEAILMELHSQCSLVDDSFWYNGHLPYLCWPVILQATFGVSLALKIWLIFIYLTGKFGSYINGRMYLTWSPIHTNDLMFYYFNFKKCFIYLLWLVWWQIHL